MDIVRARCVIGVRVTNAMDIVRARHVLGVRVTNAMDLVRNGVSSVTATVMALVVAHRALGQVINVTTAKIRVTTAPCVVSVLMNTVRSADQKTLDVNTGMMLATVIFVSQKSNVTAVMMQAV